MRLTFATEPRRARAQRASLTIDCPDWQQGMSIVSDRIQKAVHIHSRSPSRL